MSNEWKEFIAAAVGKDGSTENGTKNGTDDGTDSCRTENDASNGTENGTENGTSKGTKNGTDNWSDVSGKESFTSQPPNKRRGPKFSFLDMKDEGAACRRQMMDDISKAQRKKAFSKRRV